MLPVLIGLGPAKTGSDRLSDSLSTLPRKTHSTAFLFWDFCHKASKALGFLPELLA